MQNGKTPEDGRALRRSEKFRFLRAMGLLVVLLSLTISGRAFAFPSPMITRAEVRTYHKADGSRGTEFIAQVNGPSPEDIASFRVAGPPASPGPYEMEPEISSRQDGLFYVHDENATLSSGGYTFTVTDRLGREDSVVKVFTYGGNHPQVTSGMGPSDGEYVATTTPLLSFGGVGSGLYYQVVVRDYDDKAIWYQSPPAQDTSFRVPDGLLEPDMPYFWCVRVFDRTTGYQNFHESPHVNFFTGSSPYAIDLTQRIVAYEDSGSDNSVFLAIKDLTVAPWNITDSGVTLPDLSPHSLDTRIPGFDGDYLYETVTDSVLDGDYTFYVEDDIGKSETKNRTLDVDPVPVIAESSRMPEDNAYFTVNAPTFSWDPVSGANPPYYMLRIFDYNEQIPWYSSPITGETSIKVPESVNLPWGSSYKWRVYVLDDETWNQVNNIYVSPARTFTLYRAKPPAARAFHFGQAHNLKD